MAVFRLGGGRLENEGNSCKTLSTAMEIRVGAGLPRPHFASANQESGGIKPPLQWRRVFLLNCGCANFIVLIVGKVYFSQPGRMRWDYDSPEKKLFLVDGKNVWYYVPADHTASRTSVKQSSDWRTPLALLASKVNLENLCGSLKLAAPAEQPASRASNSIDAADRATEIGNEVLVCQPRKEDQDAFSEVFFEVNPRDQLARVTIRQPGDIETEFRFGDWRENIPIAESQFHFVPPKGVAIVDDASLENRAQ